MKPNECKEEDCVRQGWDASFKSMASNKDDALLDNDISNNFDENDREW